MSKKLIKNARIVTHETIFEGAVIVEDGKIMKIHNNGNPDESKFDEVIDLEEKHILPGLVDVHVHFRTPGQEYKEDWTTGSKAALAGGVTTVLDMPNNDPPTIDNESLQKKREIVKGQSLVNYGFYMGATPNNFKEIENLRGIAGVKIYMGSSTGSLLVDKKEAYEQFLADAKHLIAVHAENEECIKQGLEKYHDKNEPNIHSLIRDPECAYEAVRDVLHLAKKYGARLHICHASTEKEMDTVRKFKDENISVEVTPHHMFLNNLDYERYGNLIKVNPPVRDPADQMALWESIKDGTVDIVATDHAPHTYEEKKRDYADVPSGIPGVQTMLPLLLNAVNEGKLTLEKVVELTSYNPARKFGISNKGEIAEGMDADFTVVDMGLTGKVDKKYLFSKCGWSPFDGWELTGWPVMTFVGGNLMYEWRGKFGQSLGREVEYVK